MLGCKIYLHVSLNKLYESVLTDIPMQIVFIIERVNFMGGYVKCR